MQGHVALVQAACRTRTHAHERNTRTASMGLPLPTHTEPPPTGVQSQNNWGPLLETILTAAIGFNI